MDVHGCVVDPYTSIGLTLTCCRCGREVDTYTPIAGHQKCAGEDGRLVVDLRVGNFEARGCE